MYAWRGGVGRWPRLTCVCRHSTAAETKPCATVSSPRPLPPPRVPRGPTDLLQALASTVGNDPTAPHYKYHDDPYLTPLSNFHKRSHALAQEAGRKAAAWIRDEHAEWFTTRVWDPPTRVKTEHHNAEPRIAAYAPRPVYTENSKVTEDDLRHVIQCALVDDAVMVYRVLGGVSAISDRTARDLLELLCFYNEQEPEPEEWLEERWFASGAGRKRQAATWRMGGLAEEIFNALPRKDSPAYCSIVQGMAKYYQAERAYQLSREALEAGVPLSTDTYNSLLSCVGFLREGVDLRQQTMLQLLREMQQQGLFISQVTLSSCLSAVAAWGGSPALKKLAKQLLAEFRAVGVRPSLTAYYHLLCIFCKENGPRTDILTPILSELEARDTLVATEPTDTFFFVTALAVCNEHLQDITMAERVHTLLMKGDNYKLLGDAYKESIYYRHLVTVACRRAPLERTTQLLDELVPNVYVPEPSVMDEIIKTLELGGAGDRLAQAWSQLVVFGHARRIQLLERLLGAMCSCYQHQEDDVKQRMRTAAAEMLRYGERDEEEQMRDQRTPPPKLSAVALSHIIELCLDVPDASEPAWEAAAEAARRLRAGEAAGVPWSPTPLVALAERAVVLGHAPVAVNALAYIAECGFEESSSACVRVLAGALNRTESEALQLLGEPRMRLQTGMDPALLAIVDIARNIRGTVDKRDRSRVSSSSESDSSESDGE